MIGARGLLIELLIIRREAGDRCFEASLSFQAGVLLVVVACTGDDAAVSPGVVLAAVVSV